MKNESDIGLTWEESRHAESKYNLASPTDDDIALVETELGVKLPASYVKLMRIKNGGTPRDCCFPTNTPTSWADDHVEISGIFGIGREKPNSLCGKFGSNYWIEKIGYPNIGVCICDCPSAGHDLIMLDYRKSGGFGEPEVIHVDQELDFKITFLAADFQSFILGLVNESDFDTSEDDKENDIDRVERGSISTQLSSLISNVNESNIEASLRRCCKRLVDEKGYFGLHGDKQSCQVYDILFYLVAESNGDVTRDNFFSTFPSLIFHGDGDFTVRGYAMGFLEEWLDARIANDDILVSDTGKLEFSANFKRDLLSQLEDV